MSERYRAGVVGDDITGCQDIGIFFTKQGLKSITASNPDEIFKHQADVLIIDTDSRFDPAKQAYDKVAKAVKALRQVGCAQYFKKTCSVFRGNIGAEFDAMLDTLNESLMIVIAAFPKNGRTTVDGRHYVYGCELAASQFRHDPMNPMTSSDLAAIIALQSKRPIHHLLLKTIHQGNNAVRKQIEDAKKAGGYLICDCETQQDLKILAAAIVNEKVIGGSSAIAEELAVFHKHQETAQNHAMLPDKKCGILLAVGSITQQSKQQTAYALAHGVIHIPFDPLMLYDHLASERMLESCCQKALRHLLKGEHVLLQPDCENETVSQMKAVGRTKGYDEKSVSKLVSTALAELILRLIQASNQHRICIAGGDTSARIIEMLNIHASELVDEIQTGICSSLSLGEPKLLMILKSGSFGNESFLIDAINYLKQY